MKPVLYTELVSRVPLIDVVPGKLRPYYLAKKGKENGSYIRINGTSRCKEYGLPDPLFEEFGDGFKVTIFRKVSNAFEKYQPLLKEANATDVFVNNIEKVFKHCGTDTIFGQANVMEWLGCSKSKATNVMNVLKEAKVIEKVTGLGAGKYRFLKLQIYE